jgi:nitrite reductase/ring-hydroxylating ferredoxin subunit
MRAVDLDGVSIVVVRVPTGEVYALRNSCSHLRASLSNGLLEPQVLGDAVGDRGFSATEFVVRCPWHGYEFDVKTGRCPADPERNRVRVYPIDVTDGEIVLER